MKQEIPTKLEKDNLTVNEFETEEYTIFTESDKR